MILEIMLSAVQSWKEIKTGIVKWPFVDSCINDHYGNSLGALKGLGSTHFRPLNYIYNNTKLQK